MARILVIDDDPSMLVLFEAMLEDKDFEVVSVDNGVKAKELLKEQVFQLMITDMLMKPVSGIEMLAFAREEVPDMPTILVTGNATIETAVAAMKEGAFDYVTKPFRYEDLIPVVNRALSYANVLSENRQLKEALVDRRDSDSGIVGDSAGMRDVVEMAMRVAPTDSSVLILGESGTGKELIARAVHRHSKRKDQAFVPINCAALPENLLESELFGHMKGAFTGATSEKEGLFSVADGGTLFLDEISSMPLNLQGKLLRVLQEGEIRKVGGTENIKVDVRILAATHHSVEQMIREGTFREDLYYRLSVIPITIPPLRERREDILPIAQYVMRSELGPDAKLPPIAREAELVLEDYAWPGNVRELENAIRHALTFSDGQITRDDLPARVISGGVREALDRSPNQPAGPGQPFEVRPLKAFLRGCEKDYIRRVLDHFGGDKERAATALKVSLATFYRKLPDEE